MKKLDNKKSFYNLNNKVVGKIKDRKHINQFLSSELLPITKEKTIIYSGKKLKTSYIIDIIHHLLLRYYIKKENKFNLSSLILKEKYGTYYNYYIKYLLYKNILTLICDYKKGKNAKIYSLSKSILDNKIVRYKNKDKILIKKYNFKMMESANLDKTSPIDSKVKDKLIESLFMVKIDFYKSLFYLMPYIDDDEVYNKNIYSIECLNDNNIFYHFDDYGRIHTNFTILKSIVRKNCLSINNEELIEIDINNSQPLFLSKLMKQSGSKWVDKTELELFSELTISGKIYSYLMERFQIKDRKRMKEIVYLILFGKNSPNSKYDKKFSEIFPTIHRFIKSYKKENKSYKILSHVLQKMESEFVFNKVVKTIMGKAPEIYLITIHDSIMVPKSYEKLCRDIFNNIFNEEFKKIEVEIF
jgi:hypothetical protein